MHSFDALRTEQSSRRERGAIALCCVLGHERAVASRPLRPALTNITSFCASFAGCLVELESRFYVNGYKLLCSAEGQLPAERLAQMCTPTAGRARLPVPDKLWDDVPPGTRAVTMLPVWGEVLEGILEMACVWEVTYRPGTAQVLGVASRLTCSDASPMTPAPVEIRCWDLVLLFFHNYMELRDHGDSVKLMWEAIESLGSSAVGDSREVAKALRDKHCSRALRDFLGASAPPARPAKRLKIEPQK